MTHLSRLMIFLAGVFGAGGVAAAAAGSHGDSRNLAAIATILLAHAPAVLAIGLFGKGRVLMGAALVLGLGTLLFGLDLIWREMAGNALVAGIAPVGGGLMILGWIGIALSAATGMRGNSIKKD